MIAGSFVCYAPVSARDHETRTRTRTRATRTRTRASRASRAGPARGSPGRRAAASAF